MANIITNNYRLNITPGGVPAVVYLNQNENGRLLRFQLISDGSFTILSGSTAVFEGTKPDGNIFSATGTVDVTNKAVTVQEVVQMTAVEGEYNAVLRVTHSGYTIATGLIKMVIQKATTDGGAASSSELDGIIAEAQTYAETYRTLESRVDNLAHLEEGSTTGDAELIDIRVGANGKTYSTAGDAVRGQVDDLNSVLLNMSSQLIYEQKALSVSSGLLPLPVSQGDSITFKRVDGQPFDQNDQIRFYDANKNYIGYVGTPAGQTSRTWTYTYATPASYIGITFITSDTSPVFSVINNSSKSLILAEINERKNADDLINNKITILNEYSAQKEIINRFNKASISEGKYISTSTGNLLNNESFFASDFIYIGDLDSVTVSRTHIFGWYDENKNWLGHPDSINSRATDLTYEIPENAVYLRFSAYNSDLNTAQVGGAISRNNYVDYGIYKLPDLRINASQISSEDDRIIVDASGAGDYTSFTQAIYDTVDSGIDVLVKPGTYDIVAEYIALFGQTAVDNMADADSATFNGFQYGVRIRNRKVEFAPGSHLVCDWTGHTVDGTHRFSALGVDYNCEIIGLDLDCTATFYCIHDDYGIATPYTVKYENCRVVGHNITNANCIGGGCKKYSRHILNNCYFNNNLTGSATVRYHNTNAEGAEPEIYVSNCYFNNWFTPRWYGTQTSKMRVYVNNCEARSIHKLAESSSYNVDNVELYKWCNTETNPVT